MMMQSDNDRPLRVLIAHNAYQLRGGEDAVVDSEEELLRNHGHAVHRYSRNNDELATPDAPSRMRLLKDTLWSDRTVKELQELFLTFKPDVIHVHNILPLLSPSLYWAAHRAGIPVVQTLHNFRLMCPQALLLRENKVCEDCVGHIPWRAAMHRCYRDSSVQSAVVAGMIQMHRWLGTWNNKVTTYIALNDFCRDKFIESGLPPEKIVIKPNFVDPPAIKSEKRGDFLFVGRLSHEKGVDTLIEAGKFLPKCINIRVIGCGPEQINLEHETHLQLLGALRKDEVYNAMSSAIALVMPSIWYETFGLVIAEAYACETPVIASRLGAMAALVEHGKTGLLFDPGNASDLARTLAWAIEHPDEMRTMGRNARIYYEQHLNSKSNYNQLINIYLQAINKAVK